MTKCSNCNKREAIVSSQYGVTFCKVCRRSNKDIPKRGVEFTTESIKSQRMEYKRDTLQPYAGNTLSKEYIQEYGTQGIEPTKEQIKNAKYTEKGTKGWWQRNRSKGGRK